jgi:multiple sugar transport system ATP-binding protein
VISSQWLGDQTHVAAEVAGRTVVSVSHQPLHLRMGEDIALSVEARELHLFDPDTGLAIAHGNEPA